MSASLAIFTIPKPFTGEFERIQTNAIRSWQALGAEVYLANVEADTLHWAMTLSAGLLTGEKRNAYGTPLMDAVFASARTMERTKYVAFVNTDIILFDDFMRAIESCAKLPHFLMCGQRLNCEFPIAAVDGSLTTAREIRFAPGAYGMLEGVGAADYFAYHRNDLPVVPPFAVGRFRWDNWLMWDALNRGWALVDATEAVLAVHQNHTTNPRVDGDLEREYNDWLVSQNGGVLGRLTDATYVMNRDFELTERMKA